MRPLLQLGLGIAPRLADGARPRGPVAGDEVARGVEAAFEIDRGDQRLLLGLGPDELASFFDAFFDLPVDVWAPYLRIDSPPSAVLRTMSAVVRRLPWAMRRRLVVNPFGGR